MKQKPEESIKGICHRNLAWCMRFTVIAAAICCSAIAISNSPANAGDSDTKRITEIDCVVDDGRGVVDVAGDGQPEFSQTVLTRDGIRLGSKIKLEWRYEPGSASTLRIAIDSPVTKGARIVSITDDTIVAVLMTSDSGSTRAWLVTINLRLEQVMVSGMSSNTNAMSAQIITSSCTFDDRPASGS